MRREGCRSVMDYRVCCRLISQRRFYGNNSLGRIGDVLKALLVVYSAVTKSCKAMAARDYLLARTGCISQGWNNIWTASSPTTLYPQSIVLFLLFMQQVMIYLKHANYRNINKANLQQAELAECQR